MSANISLEYTYRSIDEINAFMHLFPLSPISLLIGVGCILWVVCYVFYYSPWKINRALQKEQQQEKRRKRLTLEQILVTREIEDEIEKEIQQESLKYM